MIVKADAVPSGSPVPEGMKAEVARLVEQAQFEGLQLTGEGGLLPDMIKQAVEAALQGEMTAHLGYERYAAEGRGSGNSRNGATAKTVQTAAGPAEVSVPRDRAGTFEPVTVPKGARRFTEFDDMVIGLYAKGLTTRDIAEWLEQTYGAKISHETVANITDSVNELVKAWRSRPLDEVYPIVYIDAIRVRVRDGGAVRIKACHLAVGVDLEGRKRVLGMWIEQNEGARFWLGVLTELRNRGIRDVLIVCCDGLTGLPEVVGQIWPKALIQTCVVHLIRNSMRYASWKDRKAIAAALRPIYAAATAEAASKRWMTSPAPTSAGAARPWWMSGAAPGTSSCRSWTYHRRSVGSSTPPTRSRASTTSCGRCRRPAASSPATTPSTRSSTSPSATSKPATKAEEVTRRRRASCPAARSPTAGPPHSTSSRSSSPGDSPPKSDPSRTTFTQPT